MEILCNEETDTEKKAEYQQQSFSSEETQALHSNQDQNPTKHTQAHPHREKQFCLSALRASNVIPQFKFYEMRKFFIPLYISFSSAKYQKLISAKYRMFMLIFRNI